jgi:hypothetical protein
VTAKKLTNVAQSVHQRLLNQAKSAHRPFSEFFQNYVTERFLYRLGVSPHRERFVLKGALMLRFKAFLKLDPQWTSIFLAVKILHETKSPPR